MQSIKKFLITLFFIHCNFNITIAQDTIYFHDNNLEIATKIEITGTKISFKKFSNPDGPTYTTNTGAVSTIHYITGDVLNFSIPEKPPTLKVADTSKTKWYEGDCFIYATLSDVLYGFASLQIERNFFKGRLSFKIPLSVGIVTTGADSFGFMRPYTWQPATTFEQYGYFSPGKIYSIGIEVYYYPGAPKRINYFVGLAYGYGEFEYWTSTYTFNPDKPYIYDMGIGSYQSFFFKNGLRAKLGKHIYSNVFVGMGSNKFENPGYPGFSEMYRAIEWGIGLGVGF